VKKKWNTSQWARKDHLKSLWGRSPIKRPPSGHKNKKNKIILFNPLVKNFWKKKVFVSKMRLIIIDSVTYFWSFWWLRFLLVCICGWLSYHHFLALLHFCESWIKHFCGVGRKAFKLQFMDKKQRCTLGFAFD
jgi:hypothetical protein